MVIKVKCKEQAKQVLGLDWDWDWDWDLTLWVCGFRGRDKDNFSGHRGPAGKGRNVPGPTKCCRLSGKVKKSTSGFGRKQRHDDTGRDRDSPERNSDRQTQRAQARQATGPPQGRAGVAHSH